MKRKNALVVAFIALSTVFWLWLRPPTSTPRPDQPLHRAGASKTHKDTPASGKPPPESTKRTPAGLKQAIERQVDALLEANAKTLQEANSAEKWYATLSPAQKMDFRQRCLAEDGSGIKDLVTEHLKYHRQHQLETWSREKDILAAMQAKCDSIRPFVTDLMAENLASQAVDADTGLGELALDLLAIQEENGLDAAAALAREYLMDPSPQRRADARDFLVQTGAFLDLLADFLPPEQAQMMRNTDRSHMNPEILRQQVAVLFAVVDCERGLADCGSGSFWSLQQCRDYPRSCGMTPYESLHYNTPPVLMQYYDQLLQALRTWPQAARHKSNHGDD